MGPILGVIQIDANLWVNFEGISLVGSALFGLGVISWTQDMWVFWGLGISKTWSSTLPSSLMPMTIYAEDLLDQGEPGRTRKLGLRSQTDIEDLLTYLTLLPHLFEITLIRLTWKTWFAHPTGSEPTGLHRADSASKLWPHRCYVETKMASTQKTSYETSREILQNVHTFELFDPKKWGIEWSLSYADSNYWENVDDSFEGQHVHSHF